MDSNDPTLEPKEKVQKNYEADDAVNIKLEQMDPSYEGNNCDSIQFEEVKMKNWVECGSSPFRDELGIKLETDKDHDVLDRIKDEYNTEQSDEHSLRADADGELKMEKEAAVGCEEEKLETHKDSTKSEDMDAPELTGELDIKLDGTSNAEGATEKKIQERAHRLLRRNRNKDSLSYNKPTRTTSDKNALTKLNGIRSSRLKTSVDKLSVRKKSHPLNEYICTQCKRVYKRKVSLDHHIIKMHSDSVSSVSSKIRKCPNCTYKTTRKSDFDKHLLVHDRADGRKMVTEDQDSSSASCTMQEYPDFTDIQAFLDTDIPQQLKSGSDYNLRPCDLCSAIFKRQRTLDDHIIKKHPHIIELVTSKIHECSDCPYKTTIKVNLDRHIISIHRPPAACSFNTCEHCNKPLKSKRGLDDHILRKHPNAVTSLTRKIHQCTKCKFRTIIKSDFDKHISIH